LVNNSVAAIVPATAVLPVTIHPMTNVSNEPVSRQLIAFAIDRLCASRPRNHILGS
jgi:hypothetical protein